MEQNDRNVIQPADRGAGNPVFRGNLSHASIVWGGGESDRGAYSYRLGSAIVCSDADARPCGHCGHCLKTARRCHPDIIFVDRLEDARYIQVDQIRALREDAVVMPNEAQRKVYIIRHADTMNDKAQNAFLKLLEEPPESSSFILEAEDPAGLLPTVRSRCVELSCERRSPAGGPRKADGTAGAFLEALYEGGLKMCAFSYILEKLDKTGFIEFIGSARTLLEEELSRSPGGGSLEPAYLIRAVRILNRAKDYFDSNVGLVHIAGMICAELTDRNEDSND
jgi:hypothetical protein